LPALLREKANAIVVPFSEEASYTG